MLREVDYNYLDKLVCAYAEITAYIGNVPELETKISSAYTQACGQSVEFDSFNGLLGTSYPASQQWIRHVSWIAQHVFAERALCVGNKIEQQRKGRFSSPLVGQLERLGFEPFETMWNTTRVESFGPSKPMNCIDAIFCNRAKNTVYLVKGVTLQNAAKRQSPAGLFPMPLFESVFARSFAMTCKGRVMATLRVAHDIVKCSFPVMRVIPVVLVADQVNQGWMFVAFDCTPAMRSTEYSNRVELSQYAELAHHEQIISAGMDLDQIRYMPSRITRDHLLHLPADRASRCLMILELLWHRQAAAGDKLATTSAADLGRKIKSCFELEYPPDLRRHDLEDCLERGGFIERPAYEGNRYALTPTGMVRSLLMKRMFVGRSELEDDEDLRQHILSHIYRLSNLWAQYRSGIAVCT